MPLLGASSPHTSSISSAGPTGRPVAGRERRQQRLRAIACNRDPPPAHVLKQGQGDAHPFSLEATR